MKMWSGRFDQPPDPEFELWQRSFPFDRVLLTFEAAASKVHAEALANVGILSSGELERCIAALDQIASEGIPAADDPAIEDVHHYVESRLIELAGEVGYKLHAGRSRNEQIATDLRLFVRSQIDLISSLLVDFLRELLDQASAAGEKVMPGYTHLQRAEPVLVGHWLLAYVQMFLRDLDRMSDCRRRLNQCPLGSGAIAGTILPLDRGAVAKQLAFDGPTVNSMDATSDRDFAMEFVQALSLITLHLSRWAEELILFATQEFGFLKLPQAFATGSSAMPQKKNPDALELLRGKSGQLWGYATSLFITLKGLPLAYNKDLQETQQPVFAATREVGSMLAIASAFMASVQFDFERMQQAVNDGFMNAQAAAAYLVRHGIAFRRAHELIGSAVRLCVIRGCDLEHLSHADYASCGIEADDEFYRSLGLTNVLNIHNVEGGTSPARVRESLRNAIETLAKYSEAAAHACA